MSPTSTTHSQPDSDGVGRPVRLSGLTIVLPCFNEAENLRETASLTALGTAGRSFWDGAWWLRSGAPLAVALDALATMVVAASSPGCRSARRCPSSSS